LPLLSNEEYITSCS